jgi:hypothetical protein
MRSTRRIIVLGVALLSTLASTHAWAHWCDDLWASAYDIIVRPDSDTSPKELYVENHWGYQLTNFVLTATSSSGGTVTLTAPSTLKVKGTLLPGERGTWKITAGNPAKIEDLSFHVTFGNTSGSLSKQYACYPVLGGSPVMVLKNSGDRFPSAVTAIPKNGTDPKPNTPNGCTYGDVALGRSLQLQTIADWEDMNVGLDNMLILYCAGRGSWGNNDKTVKPSSYCKDGSSTTCPAKPTAIPGSRSDYMRLWGAGALAIRKGSLGDARMKTFRQRLKCGINDADPGISGYTMFALGYLGDDADSKSFLQTQASASGDTGAVAKAALYLMGDTSQKSAVQEGAKSSSVWTKVACSGALGIVDKDDNAVTSGIIPEVKWVEPDNMGGETDNGKGMYAAHILEIVAADRRGWVYQGGGKGAVTFYGEADKPSTGGSSGSTGTGGNSGAGGSSSLGGNTGSAGSSGPPRSSSSTGSGGRSSAGGSASSSSPPQGGSSSAGGNGGQPPDSSSPSMGGSPDGASSTTPSGGGSSSAGKSSKGQPDSSGQGGSSSRESSSGSAAAPDNGNGCSCNLGGPTRLPALVFPLLAGLALLVTRRRRR